ncbi:MAG: hypothetical protein ABW224_11995 [Kibdelosporangium sp.]
MAADAIDVTLKEIDEWAGRTGVGTDERELRLLLELSRDHLAHKQPGAFALGDFDELLLGVIPANVVLESPAHARDIIRAAATLLAFLGDTDRLPPKQIEALDAELDDAGAEFVEASMSPEEAAELLEPDDSLVTMLEQLGLPTDEMPPMRLPEPGELAAAARQSALMNQAHLLGEWAGDGQEVDEKGDPTPAGIVRAAAVAGIEVADVEGLSDAPEVALLLQLANFVGFVQSSDEEGDENLTRGDALADWPDGDDETVIELWQGGLAVTLGYSLDWLVDVLDEEIDFEGVGATIFLMLFLSRDLGLPMDELSGMVQETVEDPSVLAAWTDEYGDPAYILVGRLIALGAVVVDDEEIVRLTPLGLNTMRNELVDSGVEVPLLPPVDEMTAADLVGLADRLGEPQIGAELALWLAGRDIQEAARDLLAVASGSTGPQRMWAATMVSDFGTEVEPVWQGVLDDPALLPYAKLAFARNAGHVLPDLPDEFALTPEEHAWVTIDALAMILTVSAEDTPDAVAAALSAGRPQDVLDAMWRLPHDEVVPVLIAVGELHPDKKVAKHARTVANKASSFHSQG